MANHRMTANAESLVIKKPAWGRKMQQRPMRRVGVGITIAHDPSTDPDERSYRIRLLH